MANFAVRLVHGPNWDPRRPIRGQDGWDEHAGFMDGLVENGFIILGGPVGDWEQTLHVVEAADENEIRARLALDPWASAGLLQTGSIEPWALWLDGRGLDGRPLPAHRSGGAGEVRVPGAGDAGRAGADGSGCSGDGRAGYCRAGPAHPRGGGLRVLAVGLRDPRRATPDSERGEGSRDGFMDLRHGGLVGTLQRRGEQRVGPGGADGEVVSR
jgi:hypothetical protein